MMARANKIVVLHVIPTLDVGGAEMMLYKLIKHSFGCKHVVLVLSKKTELGRKIASLNARIIYLNTASKIHTVLSIKKVFSIVREVKPDVILGWMYHSSLLSLIIKLFNNTKGINYIWNIRHTVGLMRKEKFFTMCVIKLLALFSYKADAIIYNSYVSKKKHLNIGFNNDKSYVIYNGFDESLFANNHKCKKFLFNEIDDVDKKFIIGHVARYHPMKDHELFISSAARFNVPDVIYIMIGRGVDYHNSELVSLIKKYNLSEKIKLLGERKDVHKLLSSFDIFTLTSAWGEGFPNVLGEAMLAQTLCVATNVGDSKFIVDKFGYIVPIKNTTAIIESWKKLYSMSKMDSAKLGMAAKKSVIDRFSIEHIVKLYMNLFNEVVNEKKQKEI